jgi:hypothetical protein
MMMDDDARDLRTIRVGELKASSYPYKLYQNAQCRHSVLRWRELTCSIPGKGSSTNYKEIRVAVSDLDLDLYLYR